MKNNRRKFLQKASILGIILSAGKTFSRSNTLKPNQIFHPEGFNMSGYAAPALSKVRVGIIGLGMRGPGAVKRLSLMEGVEIKALGDIRPEKVESALALLKDTEHQPSLYSGTADKWKEMCDRPDLDLIYIATPWHLHTPMAVYAMENEKHVAVEVPAARTLEECWQLVETSERTKKHCMMLENCCYDFFELLTLNMAREGYFGDIIHGEGAYIHNLIDLNFSKSGYHQMWRLKENIGRNGSLYPTHGLGPICQVMDINRGDQMDYLTSLSSADFNMNAEALDRSKEDDFYTNFMHMSYRGNMNTTLIKTKKGRSMLIQHDVSSPRPYSRIHLVSGSKAMARKWPEKKIARGHSWISAEDLKDLEEKYTPPIVKKVGELAKKVGGHGGMDFIMDWRLIDCLRNGLPLDQDVYDAALWSAIAPLSEKSVANRSQSIDVPDFTRGNWKTNKAVDISLSRGGTTNVKL